MSERKSEWDRQRDADGRLALAVGVAAIVGLTVVGFLTGGLSVGMIAMYVFFGLAVPMGIASRTDADAGD